MKNMIIASTSTVHGLGYLEYLLPELKVLFAGCKTVLFIPYARPGGISHDAYLQKAARAFASIGIELNGIHQFADPVSAIASAEGIFTGGGNTFVLVSALYQHGQIDALAKSIKMGTPYLGCSAGSNITGLTMQTTNDMPIVYPPGFRTLGMIPFNLNPHYLDPLPDSTHMGETRETRIKEFHAFNSSPVLGLREGSWLRVTGDEIKLKGELSARLFRQGKDAVELDAGADLSDLR